MPTTQKNGRRKEPLEVRRRRGEVSCAECRRHKLKCNKTIPCSTCIRKGCQALCPTGTLPPMQSGGQGSRHNDVPMQNLVRMSKRIEQLEDALQTAHNSISKTRHPLLSEDLLLIKGFIERPVILKGDSLDSDGDMARTYGTLPTPSQSARACPGTEKFIIKDYFHSQEAVQSIANSTVPFRACNPGETFPFTPLYVPVQEIQVHIGEKLPSIERATALVEAYLENFSWVQRIVDREQIYEELIPDIYRYRRACRDKAANEQTTTDPHLLAVLLAVFACGALADLTLSPWNEEANLYYRLAWTAISLKPIFENATLYTAQAFALLGMYDIFSCRKGSFEATWKIISYCMSVAVSLRLNRDPHYFSFPPKLVQRRRQVFWELFALDAWRSIDSGKPMSLISSVIDCDLPEDKEATIIEGRAIPSVWGFRLRYAKEVATGLAEKLSSVRALKYSEIMLLDQKIRDFDSESTVDVAINASKDQNDSLQRVFTTLVMVLVKDATLLLLHRYFFIRALVESPADPMQCRFAPSFLSAYRSASAIVHAIHPQVDKCAHFLVRIWPLWSHAIIASVVLGSVAACGASALAPHAYEEFDQSIDMLSKVQMHPIVKDILPTLLRLRDHAQQALSRHSCSVSLSRLKANRPRTKESYDAMGQMRSDTVPAASSEPRISPESRDARRDAGSTMPMDTSRVSLDFDTISALSPVTLLNTDFDVSFDMRASTGNENVLSLVSDDLEAWRTILCDTRFFGSHETLADDATQLNPS